ncbi:hypothetical protein, partial [Siminovitchia terrae]|uniref:hypothetical protein n=1 Tax=Siminovitchia terrae TaxID=1914933 RepID=UPI0028B158B3
MHGFIVSIKFMFLIFISVVNREFNFIHQKSPTSVSGEMNAYYSFQRGFKPWLNKVKAFGGCHRF